MVSVRRNDNIFFILDGLLKFMIASNLSFNNSLLSFNDRIISAAITKMFKSSELEIKRIAAGKVE